MDGILINETMEEEEKLRISRYFKKVMKKVSKKIINKELVTKNDLYDLFEEKSEKNQISASPVYIKYKYTGKSFPKVSMECNFISLKIPLKYSLTGTFRIEKPKKYRNKLVAKRFYLESCEIG